MPSKAVFDVPRIRAAAQARADETSIRATAAEIGMSFTGLRGFLAGGSPHARTLKTLVEWYLRRRNPDDHHFTPTELDVEAAVLLLRRYIIAEGREELGRRRARDLERRLFGPRPSDD